jgi:hypothetical protein
MTGYIMFNLDSYPREPEDEWEEYDRELSACCPCYAAAELQPECLPNDGSDVEICAGNPELHAFAEAWDTAAWLEMMTTKLGAELLYSGAIND